MARVMCVDDNELVGRSLGEKFCRSDQHSWLGWIPGSEGLLEEVKSESPDILLLDLDMPGRDVFSALSEVTTNCPRTRTIIFSGHVRGPDIERALDCGAWGYVSKNDGEESLLKAIDAVMAGELGLSAQPKAVLAAQFRLSS